MFRASPASGESAMEAYKTFGINTFQMKNRSPGFSTAKPTMSEDMDGQAHFSLVIPQSVLLSEL